METERLGLPLNIVNMIGFGSCGKENCTIDKECQFCDQKTFFRAQVMLFPCESIVMFPTVFFAYANPDANWLTTFHTIAIYYIAAIETLKVYFLNPQYAKWHSDEWFDQFDVPLQLAHDKYMEHESIMADKLRIPNDASMLDIFRCMEECIFLGMAILEECGLSLVGSKTLDNRIQANYKDKCEQWLTTAVIETKFGRALSDRYYENEEIAKTWNLIRKASSTNTTVLPLIKEEDNDSSSQKTENPQEEEEEESNTDDVIGIEEAPLSTKTDTLSNIEKEDKEGAMNRKGRKRSFASVEEDLQGVEKEDSHGAEKEENLSSVEEDLHGAEKEDLHGAEKEENLSSVEEDLQCVEKEALPGAEEDLHGAEKEENLSSVEKEDLHGAEKEENLSSVEEEKEALPGAEKEETSFSSSEEILETSQLLLEKKESTITQINMEAEMNKQEEDVANAMRIITGMPIQETIIPTKEGVVTVSVKEKEGVVTVPMKEEEGVVTIPVKEEEVTVQVKEKEGVVTVQVKEEEGVVTIPMKEEEEIATIPMKEEEGVVTVPVKEEEGAVTIPMKEEEEENVTPVKMGEDDGNEETRCVKRLAFKKSSS